MSKMTGLVESIVNKSGNFVFSTWHGIQVMRAYNPRKSKPRSETQISQSEKFLFTSQYSIAMSKTTFLKHLWKLKTPHRKQPYNMLLKLNLESAIFEPDNTLCPNKLIINNNDDDLKSLYPSEEYECKDNVWKIGPFKLIGCGTDPDGLLIVLVLNSNLLTDPDQSPFRDAKICESYHFVKDFSKFFTSTEEIYKDIFDLCCPECLSPGSLCCDSCLWLIPVFSNGLDASFLPSLITKASLPIITCITLKT